jgi:radical SAM superfamily enzyme YgiQ (UPF0313 family)
VLEPDYGKIIKAARGSFIFIPMGVFAIGDLLEKEGFAVKIVNYPLEQYLNEQWSLSDFLKNTDFDMCAIDLHWIHNAYGTVEVAKIVKKANPNAKVILGGFSASYYHDQILKHFNAIDGVIRGDGEVPLLEYARKVFKGQSLNSVPNLSYRNDSKQLRINPLSYTAKNLDDFCFANVSLLEHAQEYFELSRKIMGISFNVSIGRGCPFNCPFCAGGQRAQERLSGRKSVILRSPEKVIEDIDYIMGKYKIQSLFFGHGTYPANLKYWKKLFALIQKEKYDIGGDLEIWRLPFPRDLWKHFYHTFTRKHSSISISPRTISSQVQEKISKVCDPTFRFPETQIYDLIKNANLFKLTLRIWLTIGYPFQTYLDILKDFAFSMKCLMKYGFSKQYPITIMNEPYHIFPGSPAHEAPELFKIKLKYNSFLEVSEAFKRNRIRFWYNMINYNTDSFSDVSIRAINTLFFLSSFPMLLTSSPKYPKVERVHSGS